MGPEVYVVVVVAPSGVATHVTFDLIEAQTIRSRQEDLNPNRRVYISKTRLPDIPKSRQMGWGC